MTELRHGSNVAALQTEAVLDVATDEWVINTPDEGATKWCAVGALQGQTRHALCPWKDGTGLPRRWIGNGAEDGQAASVFARLKVPSPDGSGAVDDHGVHAFVVPLRDAGGAALPGVEIKDCGYKARAQRSHALCRKLPSVSGSADRGLWWRCRLRCRASTTPACAPACCHLLGALWPISLQG